MGKNVPYTLLIFLLLTLPKINCQKSYLQDTVLSFKILISWIVDIPSSTRSLGVCFETWI